MPERYLLPDESGYVADATRMLDTQLPGTTGPDRARRIATIADSLRQIDKHIFEVMAPDDPTHEDDGISGSEE